MRGQPLVKGIQAMIVFLVRAAIFPLTWLWAMGIARRHTDTDPNATKKVGAAIVVGLIAAAGVGYLLYDFQEGARAGMYDTMEGRLAQVYGENAFNDQTVNIVAKSNQVTVLTTNVGLASAARTAALDEGNMTAYEAEMGKVVDLSLSLAQAQRELTAAQVYTDRLAEEHQFFASIHTFIIGQDDAGLTRATAQRAVASQPDATLGADLLAAEKARDTARKALDEAVNEILRFDLMAEGEMPYDQADRDAAEAALGPAQAAHDDALVAAQQALSAARAAGFELPVPKEVYDAGDINARTTTWLSVKTDAESDMAGVMIFLLFPGVIGVFYAPVFVALGSVMANAWEPSSSVGYKKYPGLSLALFLFLGAFGWPALLFSAWGFWDIDVRSKEGQIAL